MTLPCFALKLLMIGASVGLVHAETAGPNAAGDAACEKALDQLEAREEQQRAARTQAGASSAESATGRALNAARRQAAKACLGGPSDPPLQGPRAQPPLSVTPIGQSAEPSTPAALREPAPAAALGQLMPPTGMRRAVPSPAPRPVAAPPVDPRPPLSRITHCDSAGCWNSEGQFLMRTGPNLAGPPGLCTSQAGILNCR